MTLPAPQVLLEPVPPVRRTPQLLIDPEPPPLPMIVAGPPRSLLVVESRAPMRRAPRFQAAHLAVGACIVMAIAAVVGVGLIINAMPRPTANAPPPSRRDTSTDDVDDKRSTDAEDKRLNEDQVRRLFDVAFISAEDLADECALNALAATEKYRGRMVRVTGRVIAITTNKDGLPLVLLQTDSVWVVRVFLNEDTVPAASRFNVGQPIALLAVFGGVGGTVIDLGGGVISDEEQKEWLKGSRRR